jgi:hypothetical protein
VWFNYVKIAVIRSSLPPAKSLSSNRIPILAIKVT